jgi:hypothetical protein
MKYLLFICADGVEGTPEDEATVRDGMPGWLDEMDHRGIRVYGHALKPVETATTVRVRRGETLLTDGPFAESKEFIGGFDILDCANLDDAVEAAALHPLAWFHKIEVRPFYVPELGGEMQPIAPIQEVRHGQRFLLLMCLDGIPAAPEVEEAVVRDGMAWYEELKARGVAVYGAALNHADTATTVSVRNGETVLSDGPFTETKEFIGGFTILDCEGQEEAVALAAKHPLASHHMVEVRQFAVHELGDEAIDE